VASCLSPLQQLLLGLQGDPRRKKAGSVQV
jgi:hypothetical protein